MSNLKTQTIEHLYAEALRHKIHTDDFLKNSRAISSQYKDNFGMTKIWLDYHKTENYDNTFLLLDLFSKMKDELIKHYNL